MFEAFINRSLAYQVKNHVALITFSTNARVQQGITEVIEDFRNSVRYTECHGDTALWDALELARENISAYAEKFPEVKKRIICLSDGEDTKSLHSKEEVCHGLRVSPYTICTHFLRKIILSWTLL
jgi:Mg-chelatase subunit ChlD